MTRPDRELWRDVMGAPIPDDPDVAELSLRRVRYGLAFMLVVGFVCGVAFGAFGSQLLDDLRDTTPVCEVAP